MNEIMNEAPEDFVKRVKELLEAITENTYKIMEKQYLRKPIWSVKLDEKKMRIGENKGACWIQEDKDGVIHVYSDNLYDVGDVAGDKYGVGSLHNDTLLDKRNWEKYREKVPGIIAELEAVERIANEMNSKYGTGIKLFAGHHPYFETSFDAKDMSDEEKLREIEKHARAMLETWKLWREWRGKFGLDIYAETSKMPDAKLTESEYVDKVKSRLSLITNAAYSETRGDPGDLFNIIGDLRGGKGLASNRGAWYFKEMMNKIFIASDNLETINARSLAEYNLIERGETDDMGFKVTVVSPDLIKKIAEQVSKEFDVKIEIMEYKTTFFKRGARDGRSVIKVVKGRSAFGTSFLKGDMKPYRKLYEIERHAKALAEAWRRMKELAKEEEDTKA
jgi:hypothetical protein